MVRRNLRTGRSKYPFVESATGVNKTGTFSLPGSFVIDFKLNINSPYVLVLGSFFIERLEETPDGIIVAINARVQQQPGSINIGVAFVAIAGFVPDSHYEMVPVGPGIILHGYIKIGSLSGLVGQAEGPRVFNMSATRFISELATIKTPTRSFVGPNGVMVPPIDMGYAGFQGTFPLLPSACDEITGGSAGGGGEGELDWPIEIVEGAFSDSTYDAFTEAWSSGWLDNDLIWVRDLFASTTLPTGVLGRYVGQRARNAFGIKVSDVGGAYYLAIDTGLGNPLTDTDHWRKLGRSVDALSPLPYVGVIIGGGLLIANGAQSIISGSAPTDFASTIDFNITDADSSITAGTISVTGTDVNGVATSGTVTLSTLGTHTYTTAVSFKTISSIVITDLVGEDGVDDEIEAIIHQYPAGILRSVGSDTYVSNTPTTGEPGVSTDWTLVVLNSMGGWDNTTDYAVGDFVQAIRPLFYIRSNAGIKSINGLTAEAQFIISTDNTILSGPQDGLFNSITDLKARIADATHTGILSLTSQTIVGQKTFNNTIFAHGGDSFGGYVTALRADAGAIIVDSFPVMVVGPTAAVTSIDPPGTHQGTISYDSGASGVKAVFVLSTSSPYGYDTGFAIRLNTSSGVDGPKVDGLDADPSPASWNSGTTYNAGDMVSDGTGFYYSLTTNTNSTPATNPGDWQGYANAVAGLTPVPFDPGATYTPGTVTQICATYGVRTVDGTGSAAAYVWGLFRTVCGVKFDAGLYTGGNLMVDSAHGGLGADNSHALSNTVPIADGHGNFIMGEIDGGNW